MSDKSSIHVYFNWAKERIDEMDAALASFERQSSQLQGDARTKAQALLTKMREKRDDFQQIMKKQAQASEDAWIGAKAKLEADWNIFETEVQKYLDAVGTRMEQQNATFRARADAQMKAWQEWTDKIHDAAKGYSAEQRVKVEDVVRQMRADAEVARARLNKLSGAGTESWSALKAALSETRAAFDRAGQAAQEAFKRVG